MGPAFAPLATWWHTTSWRSLLTLEFTGKCLKVVVMMLAAGALLPLLNRGLRQLLGPRLNEQHQIILRRVISYFVWGLVLATSLRELGFDLTFLAGAATIFGAAATFGSQTSVSQIVSGLFLVAEQPFHIGDIITMGGVTGEVLSIDLLSTKVRTPDNLFVRIPNETSLKSIITTVSHFPIRRLDISLGVNYSENIAHVSKVLFEVAHKNPVCLEDPKPIFMFNGFGDSSLTLQFCVWGRRERFLDLKNSMHAGIQEAFARANIDIPFPHTALVAGNKASSIDIAVAAPKT